MKKLSLVVWLRKWYEIIRAHGSVRLVSLEHGSQYTSNLSEESVHSHPLVCLGDRTPENAAIEILILVAKEIEAVWCGEVDIEQPS